VLESSDVKQLRGGRNTLEQEIGRCWVRTRSVVCGALQVDDLIATGGTLKAGINLMSESAALRGLCSVVCDSAIIPS
jgi:hypothetical protein